MFPISGTQLIQFIPQKPPFVFISSLNSVDEHRCTTSFVFTDTNVLCSNGKLSLAGLLENMAQSAGCKMGYEDFMANKKGRRGFIGEVKEFSVTRLPAAAEELSTEVLVEGKVFNAVVLLACTVFSGAEKIAACKMKVFFEPDPERLN